MHSGGSHSGTMEGSLPAATGEASSPPLVGARFVGPGGDVGREEARKVARLALDTSAHSGAEYSRLVQMLERPEVKAST